MGTTAPPWESIHVRISDGKENARLPEIGNRAIVIQELRSAYEHQRPELSVAWLIAVHVFWFGFLVSPHGLHL